MHGVGGALTVATSSEIANGKFPGDTGMFPGDAPGFIPVYRFHSTKELLSLKAALSITKHMFDFGR